MNRDAISVKIFKALGHPLRYQIIKFLLNGPRCVCELNEVVEFSQSNLSQHLRILKDAGVVVCNKAGLKIYYELAGDKVEMLIKVSEEYVDSYLAELSKGLYHSRL